MSYFEAEALLARATGQFELAQDFEEYALGRFHGRRGWHDQADRHAIRATVVSVEVASAAVALAVRS